MSKTAFIFPGQGAQYIGMSRDICEQFKASARVFEQASESLGISMQNMVFQGDEETLKITENTQPAILTASIACLAPILEKGIKPDVVAGLSIGEYAAHVAAGTFAFEEAVSLVRKRGKYMQEAVPLGMGTMAAIIGLEKELVLECCKKASSEGVIEPANFNCPGQIVLAGEIRAVEKAVELCRENGAKRSVILPVSAPFHCSMLKSAGERLEGELVKCTFNEMSIPVVSNVTAEYVTDSSQVKDLLVKQVSSPVLWEDSIRKMIENGIDTFIEVGPGKVLSGFVKKTCKDVRIYNVEDIDSLNKTLEGILS